MSSILNGSSVYDEGEFLMSSDQEALLIDSYLIALNCRCGFSKEFHLYGTKKRLALLFAQLNMKKLNQQLLIFWLAKPFAINMSRKGSGGF